MEKKKKELPHILKQKKMYIFLAIFTLVGIIFGCVFITMLNDIDHQLVSRQLQDFFLQIKENNINYKEGFINSISTNLLSTVFIWLLGISIVGIPIILFLLFLKGFTTGFSIAVIVKTYHVKGILGAITYVFPHHILSLLLSIILTFYAVNFSIKLFSYLFLKKSIDLKQAMQKYSKILGFCLIGFVLTSLIESFLSPIIMKLFTNLIK